MRRINLHQALFRAAQIFGELGSRLSLRSTDLLAARVDGEPWPVVLSVTEGGSSRRGLLLVRGPEALTQMMALVAGGVGEEALRASEMISCSFERLAELPEPARHLVRRAAPRDTKEGDVVPSILVKPPGQSPRAPLDVEAALTLAVLQGALLAQERRWLTVELVRRREGLFTLVVQGDPRAPELSAELGNGDTLDEPPPPQLYVDRERLQDLPRLEQVTWLVGCPMTPVTLTGTDELVRALLILDRKTGRLIDGEPLSGYRWAFAAASHLVEAMLDGRRSAGGVPGELLLADLELARLVGPEVRAVGVRCRHEPAVEGSIASALEEFLEGLRRAGR